MVGERVQTYGGRDGEGLHVLISLLLPFAHGGEGRAAEKSLCEKQSENKKRKGAEKQGREKECV
jgi:hypothetical protein